MSDTIKKHEEQKEEIGHVLKGDTIKETKTEVKFTPVKTTPFQISEHEGKYYVLWGANRVSDAFETFKEAKKDALRIDWNRLTVMMIFTASKTLETLKNNIENGTRS